MQGSRRKKAEESLRDSEERMNLAAEAANLGMWVWDVKSDTVWMTDKGRALLGIGTEERLDSGTLGAHVHHQDRRARNAAIQRALNTRGEYVIEYRVQLPDGKLRWIEARGRCMDVENSKVEDGRRAGEIVRGIRGMVRKGEEVRDPVDLNDVIAIVLRLVHSEALERHCVLVTELDPELPLVEADRVQLQQVLLNLVVNAFEAMRETPVAKRRVIIRSERESGRRVRVSVRDFGTGLPVEEPERIFERFFSTKREGMGMGLAIAHSRYVPVGAIAGTETTEYLSLLALSRSQFLLSY